MDWTKERFYMLQKISFALTIAVVFLFLIFLCMYRTSLYLIMQINVYLLAYGGLIMFPVVIISIASYIAKKKVRIWFLIFQIIFFMVLVVTCVGYYENVARPEVNGAWFYSGDFIYIRNVLLEYAQTHNGVLPSADKWCDILYENKQDYRIRQILKSYQENTSNIFSFNKSLSEMPVDGIDGKLVLLFQSKNGWDLNGGKELMVRSDRYPHVYILFFDGTFGDYDVSKNSLRFLEFGLHQADYLPLKWNPATKE